MIGKYTKRLGIAQAREEMRIVSEYEAKDRTNELMFFGLAVVMVFVGVLGTLKMSFGSAVDIVVLLGYFAGTAGAFYTAWDRRKTRLDKLAKREAVVGKLNAAVKTDG